MEFGILKSKIEEKLARAYSNNTLSEEIKVFKKIVLNNPNVSRAYHIYNELSKNKGFDKKFAEDFVNECIDLFSKIQLTKKSISQINEWTKNITCENQYKQIDIVIGKNTLIIENLINSKNSIINNLTKKEFKSNIINLPIEKIVEVVNSNLKNYLSELNESELSQVKKYLTLPQSEVNKRFEVLSEMVIEKLETMLVESDDETKTKINQTIDKIKSEKVDSITLIKLKTLNENL
jgi:hypothetical protein